MNKLRFLVHHAFRWCGLARGPFVEQLELPLRFTRRRR
jgi:hypothetical protein